MNNIITIISTIIFFVYSSVSIINGVDSDVSAEIIKEIQQKKGYPMIFRGVELYVEYNWEYNSFQVYDDNGPITDRLEADRDVVEEELRCIIPYNKDI